MRELGLSAYRFSVSWSRVLPDGHVPINHAGIGFYDRLVDALLEYDIEPFVTLYHWDLPGALDDKGGWLNRDVAEWFADYARVLYLSLADRVTRWATINEPWVVSDAGYLHGTHAPGHRSTLEAPYVSHNLLRAHGAAVQSFRAEANGSIGLVLNLEPKDPASDKREDVRATRLSDAYMNRQFLDPLFKGRYPEEMSSLYRSAWPEFPERDFDLISAPIDFLGVNYYTRGIVRHDPEAYPFGYSAVAPEPESSTALGWEIHPVSLTRTLQRVKNEYTELPLYITENGAAFEEPSSVSSDTLADPRRVEYLRDHIRAARIAMERGVDLRGYFVWSLLDNFEWTEGYSKRFGLVHVDFQSQRRTPKSSALFYRDQILCSRGT